MASKIAKCIVTHLKNTKSLPRHGFSNSSIRHYSAGFVQTHFIPVSPAHTRATRLFSGTCVCRTQTEGDRELVDFLKEEIVNEEKDNVSDQLPQKITDFDVTKANRAEIELTRKYNNEAITVKLNINSSVDDENQPTEGYTQEQLENQQTQPEAMMVSKPPFTVTIAKGDQRLMLACSFPDRYNMDDQPPEGASDQDYEDLLEIVEISMLNEGETELDENVYIISADNMDQNLYAMMLVKLEERGINEQFLNALTEYCTAYEHRQYTGFLKRLQEFSSN